VGSDTRVKFERTSVSTVQTFQLIELPDIPGIVVQVRRVVVRVASISTGTGMAFRLYHNIDDSVTLAFADIPGTLWFDVDIQGTVENTWAETVYDPPYELIGKQRYDTLGSAGTASAGLMIMYTTRKERNRTLWNEIRARTSREGG